jgi:hypothetical protein
MQLDGRFILMMSRLGYENVGAYQKELDPFRLWP